MQKLAYISLIISLSFLSCRKDIEPDTFGSSNGYIPNICDYVEVHTAPVYEVYADSLMSLGDTMSIELITSYSIDSIIYNFFVSHNHDLNTDISCNAEYEGCQIIDPTILNSVYYNFVPSTAGLNTLNFESDSGTFITIEVQVD